MPEAVIVDAIRTPIGRAVKGSLKTVRADELGNGGTDPGIVCGQTQASCEDYVDANLDTSDATASDITAADRATDVRSEADFVRVTWRYSVKVKRSTSSKQPIFIQNAKL